MIIGSLQRAEQYMHTQVEQALEGTITPQMHDIARSENIDPYELCEWIAAGSIVIMQRKKRCCGIGKAF